MTLDHSTLDLAAPTQALVLAVVEDYPQGVDVAVVARLTELAPKHASNVLARLVRRGLVTRVSLGFYRPGPPAESLRLALADAERRLAAEQAAHARTREALQLATRALHLLSGGDHG